MLVNADAQVIFQKTYGGDGDRANSVKQTADGGYIIAGWTNNYGQGSSDVYLVKTNANGETQWTRTYGSSSIFMEYANAVQQLPDGGYIIVGRTDNYGAGGEDVLLIRTDENGDTLWTRTYGTVYNDWANYVQRTSDNGFIIAGDFISGAGYYLIKTDANGDTLWTKAYGTMGNEEASVILPENNGYVIAGTKGFGSYYNYNIMYVNMNGEVDSASHSYSAGVNTSNYLKSFIKTTDGKYLLAGYAFNNTDGYFIYLVKTKTNGDTLWTKTYGGSGYDYAYSVRNTADGGYIIAGSTKIAGVDNALLIKTDSNGDTLWTRTFGGAYSAYTYSVEQTSDLGYIVTGTISNQGNPPEGIYLIKTDADGNSGCNQSYSNIIPSRPASFLDTPLINEYAGTVAGRTTAIVGNGGEETTLCMTVGTEKFVSADEINIYPNPVIGKLNIVLPQEGSCKYEVRMMNSNGSVLLNSPFTSLPGGKGENHASVDVSEFPNGLYLLSLQNGRQIITVNIMKK